MDYVSLSEIQWKLRHGLSEMAPDYLQFLQRIKEQTKKKIRNKTLGKKVRLK